MEKVKPYFEKEIIICPKCRMEYNNKVKSCFNCDIEFEYPNSLNAKKVDVDKKQNISKPKKDKNSDNIDKISFKGGYIWIIYMLISVIGQLRLLEISKTGNVLIAIMLISVVGLFKRHKIFGLFFTYFIIAFLTLRFLLTIWIDIAANSMLTVPGLTSIILLGLITPFGHYFYRKRKLFN